MASIFKIEAFRELTKVLKSFEGSKLIFIDGTICNGKSTFLNEYVKFLNQNFHDSIGTVRYLHESEGFWNDELVELWKDDVQINPGAHVKDETRLMTCVCKVILAARNEKPCNLIVERSLLNSFFLFDSITDPVMLIQLEKIAKMFASFDHIIYIDLIRSTKNILVDCDKRSKEWGVWAPNKDVLDDLNSRDYFKVLVTYFQRIKCETAANVHHLSISQFSSEDSEDPIILEYLAGVDEGVTVRIGSQDRHVLEHLRLPRLKRLIDTFLTGPLFAQLVERHSKSVWCLMEQGVFAARFVRADV